mmetsp:Transcript_24929/g.58512  ORF Transcript_24929/g.58512 Transcript_24929/m.58512 type:complete len:200 (+) Transcript_24929:752-1351(+)
MFLLSVILTCFRISFRLASASNRAAACFALPKTAMAVSNRSWKSIGLGLLGEGEEAGGAASDVFGPVGPVDPVFEGISFDLASDTGDATVTGAAVSDGCNARPVGSGVLHEDGADPCPTRGFGEAMTAGASRARAASSSRSWSFLSTFCSCSWAAWFMSFCLLSAFCTAAPSASKLPRASRLVSKLCRSCRSCRRAKLA